jgi:DNA-binding NarL/FixJ family response regulator
MGDRILVVDDHEEWRRRIRDTLRGDSRWEIVGELARGLDAIHKAGELKADIVLLDISLPELNGTLVARRLLARDPELKILFFSEERSVEIVKAALGTGARGYLLKSDARSLLAALEAITQGRPFISEGLTDESEG